MGSTAVLIRGGDVVTGGGVHRAEVRLEDGRIVALGERLPVDGATTIDADGLLVLPGLIDCHTHFGLETGGLAARDDFEAGSASAAAGGVTTYVNFAPPRPDGDMGAAVADERRRADGHTLVDYALHLSVGTPSQAIEHELDALVAAGVTSIKAYTTYRETPYFTSDWDLRRVLRAAAPRGVLTMVHAENDEIVAGATAALAHDEGAPWRDHAASRPEAAETAAVATALALAQDAGAPLYLVHLTLPWSVRLANDARRAGVAAHAEACAHHLSFDERVYAGADAERFVMTPPLRSEAARRRLVEAVTARLVHASGSDHCGFDLHQRDPVAGAAGIPGVETLWRVLYTVLVAGQGTPVEDACALLTRNPAAIFGLTGKGDLAVGNDADVTLFDPAPRERLDERTLVSHAGYSPWNGTELRGRIVRTISRGRTVYDGERVLADPGHGRFVACAPYDAERVARALGEPSPEPAPRAPEPSFRPLDK